MILLISASTCEPPPDLLVLCPYAVQVALDVQHHHTMASLQQRVSPREKIVGWFSTGDPDVTRSRDALIHSFYGNECPNPVSHQRHAHSVQRWWWCAM